MAFCVSLKKKQSNEPYGYGNISHLKPFNYNQSNWSSVFWCSSSCSDVYSYIFFPLMTKAERSSGATSPTTQNLHHLFFFCITINAWPYKGLLTVFHHLTVTLLSFFCMHGTTFEMPPWSHLLWEDLHFLSLYYALILVSYYLWKPRPQKKFYLNSVQMDPVMLTWLCICK